MKVQISNFEFRISNLFFLLSTVPVVLTTFVGSRLGAQKAGVSGAQFLKIGAEARGVAMGGACIATADDITSLYWNPAGLAFVEHTGVILSDMDWVYDIRNDFVGLVMPQKMGGGVLGVSITALTAGKEEVTTVEDPQGTGEEWDASSVAIALSYGKHLTPQFAFGVTCKYLQERIWDARSHGLGVDFGTWLNPGVLGNLRCAFVITNLGPTMCFKGGQLVSYEPYGQETQEEWVEREYKAEAYSLPLCFNMGLGYDILYENRRITLGAVMSYPTDGAEKYRVGLEYGIKEVFFIRGGYIWDRYVRFYRRNDRENFSAGLGLRTTIGGQQLIINYAAYDMGRLGLRNQISLYIGL